jgi:hypothetical protein
MTHIQRIKIHYKFYLFVTNKKLWLFSKDLLFASSAPGLFRHGVVSLVTITIPEKPGVSIFRVRDRGGMFLKKFGKHHYVQNREGLYSTKTLRTIYEAAASTFKAENGGSMFLRYTTKHLRVCMIYT